MRTLKRIVKPLLLLRALNGVAFIWLFLGKRGDTAHVIHRTFCKRCWRDAGVSGQAGLIVGLIFFLPALIITAAVCTQRCGRRVCRETGIRPWRQFVGQIGIGIRLAVSPPWYYMFEFYHHAHRQRAPEYLYFFELKGAVYHDLQRRWSQKETLDALSDKALFSRRCHRYGLAVVPVTAVAENGRVVMEDGGVVLPTTDLFFKPRRGAGGRGASCWYYESGVYRSTDSKKQTAGALLDDLREKSRSDDYIVRPLVTNHGALAGINAGALSTVRVMTCRTEAGAIVCTHAVLRMARAVGSPVDNFHRGGIAAPVDLASGVLGSATDVGWSADSAWHTTHPASGAAIVGVALPFWHDTLALARCAHNAFGDQILVGWDIAILTDGPYLVEGNKGADLDIIQRLHREPVGNSQLGRSLAYYLTCSEHAFTCQSSKG